MSSDKTFMHQLFFVTILVHAVRFHSCEIGSCTSEIRGLAVIFRHGDRAPISPFPCDLNATNFQRDWPDGAGRLTERGHQRMIRLGYLLRQEYEDFFTKEKKAEVHVRSADISRCIDSATDFVKGIGQEANGMVIDKEMLSFPQPGLHFPLIRQIIQSTSFRRIMLKADFLLSKLEITSNSSLFQFFKMWEFADNVIIQKLQNKKLPDWITDQLLWKVEQFHRKAFKSLTSHKVMQRMLTGLLYQHISNRFSQQELDDSLISPLLIYSTQDVIVKALLHTLGYGDSNVLPPFASAIVMELHQDVANRRFYMLPYYTDDVSRLRKRILMPATYGFGSLCDMESLYGTTANMTQGKI